MTSRTLTGGLSVIGYIFAAALFSCALAYAVITCLSICPPLSRFDRIPLGSPGCFVAWVAVVVYAFTTRSA